MINDSKSKKYYKDSPLLRILGIGKGMGWSPTLWSLVNDITLSLMKQTFPIEIFISPLINLEIITSLEDYVYDFHDGVNTQGVGRFNSEHVTSHTILQTISLHLHKYE